MQKNVKTAFGLDYVLASCTAQVDKRCYKMTNRHFSFNLLQFNGCFQFVYFVWQAATKPKIAQLLWYYDTAFLKYDWGRKQVFIKLLLANVCQFYFFK